MPGGVAGSAMPTASTLPWALMSSSSTTSASMPLSDGLRRVLRLDELGLLGHLGQLLGLDLRRRSAPAGARPGPRWSAPARGRRQRRSARPAPQEHSALDVHDAVGHGVAPAGRRPLRQSTPPRLSRITTISARGVAGVVLDAIAGVHSFSTRVVDRLAALDEAGALVVGVAALDEPGQRQPLAQRRRLLSSSQPLVALGRSSASPLSMTASPSRGRVTRSAVVGDGHRSALADGATAATASPSMHRVGVGPASAPKRRRSGAHRATTSSPGALSPPA